MKVRVSGQAAAEQQRHGEIAQRARRPPWHPPAQRKGGGVTGALSEREVFQGRTLRLPGEDQGGVEPVVGAGPPVQKSGGSRDARPSGRRDSQSGKDGQAGGARHQQRALVRGNHPKVLQGVQNDDPAARRQCEDRQRVEEPLRHQPPPCGAQRRLDRTVCQENRREWGSNGGGHRRR